jgi:ArsR family transcriptional regulator, cadmium/lead-responsive transcriptional repressor
VTTYALIGLSTTGDIAPDWTVGLLCGLGGLIGGYLAPASNLGYPRPRCGFCSASWPPPSPCSICTKRSPSTADTPPDEYSKGCTVSVMETVTHGQVLARFGHALSDPTRARLLLALRDAPGYPADLADLLGVTRQNLSNHLACLRGCGLLVAVPEGRRSRYELADTRLRHALGDLLGLVLAVDPAACPDAADKGCC